jgi:hypothetical protein
MTPMSLMSLARLRSLRGLAPARDIRVNRDNSPADSKDGERRLRLSHPVG